MSEAGGDAVTAITVPLFVEELPWYCLNAFAILVLGVETWIGRVDKQIPRPMFTADFATETHR